MCEGNASSRPGCQPSCIYPGSIGDPQGEMSGTRVKVFRGRISHVSKRAILKNKYDYSSQHSQNIFFTYWESTMRL